MATKRTPRSHAANGNGHQTQPDPLLAAMEQSMRARVFHRGRYGLQFDGRRDLVEVLGYLEAPTFQDFWAYSLRGLGARIVDLWPSATWAQPPTVEETNEPGNNTGLEVDWQNLVEDHDIWGYCYDLDHLAQIGEYGVLLVGVDGVTDYEAPLSTQGRGSIRYLRAYRQDHAEILTYDTDRLSPRYGLPETYRIQTKLDRTSGGEQIDQQFPVHHSHIIHFADGTRENRVLGHPILLKVIDALFDSLKTLGGVSEMTYRDGKRRVVAEMREGFHFANPVDEKKRAKQVQAFSHDLLDFLQVDGTDIKSINGTIPNIEGNYLRIMQYIAAVLDVPMRKLFGSEQGNLATDQDNRSWLARVVARLNRVSVPRIVRPLVDFCIENSIVRPPGKGGYNVILPDLLALSPVEEADVNLKTTQSLRAYVGQVGDPETIVTREEFRTLGLSAWNLDAIPDGGFPEEDDDDGDPEATGPDADVESET